MEQRTVALDGASYIADVTTAQSLAQLERAIKRMRTGDALYVARARGDRAIVKFGSRNFHVYDVESTRRIFGPLSDAEAANRAWTR